MRRLVSAFVLALLLSGCEELGNPTSGGSSVATPWSEWTGPDARLRTRAETFRVTGDPREIFARYPNVQLIDPAIRPGGFVGVVTVDVLEAKWMRFGTMATDVEQANGVVVRKLWSPPQTPPPWQILVALDAPARAAITRTR